MKDTKNEEEKMSAKDELGEQSNHPDKKPPDNLVKSLLTWNKEKHDEDNKIHLNFQISMIFIFVKSTVIPTIMRG